MSFLWHFEKNCQNNHIVKYLKGNFYEKKLMDINHSDAFFNVTLRPAAYCFIF